MGARKSFVYAGFPSCLCKYILSYRYSYVQSCTSVCAVKKILVFSFYFLLSRDQNIISLSCFALFTLYFVSFLDLYRGILVSVVRFVIEKFS